MEKTRIGGRLKGKDIAHELNFDRNGKSDCRPPFLVLWRIIEWRVPLVWAVALAKLTGRQAGWQAGRLAGRQAGRQEKRCVLKFFLIESLGRSSDY